jgi:hypothetical protein
VGGKFDDLAALGGTLLQAKAIDPEALETLPAEANTLVKRITTPMFGASLIEAIDDSLTPLVIAARERRFPKWSCQWDGKSPPAPLGRKGE